MRIRYKLKNPLAHESLLLLVINDGPLRFVRSTGLKVMVAGWDQSKQRHKDRYVNQAITILRNDIERQAIEASVAGESLVERLKGLSSQHVPTPFEMAERLTSAQHNLSLHLNPSTRWDDITPAWVAKWVAGLVESDLSTNYVKFLLTGLMSLLKRGAELGYHEQKPMALRRFNIKAEDTTSVFLTVEELRAIASVELPPNLDASRRLFLIGAYTGLRHSDFSKLKAADFAGDYLHWRGKKTGDLVTIPISDALRAVVRSGIPDAKSITMMNYDVKDIARVAGIDAPVQWSRTLGRVKVNKVLPKWQLVSSHTARRSFATNLYLAGIDIISIMRFTGHRTTQSFMRYIRITNLETAERLKDQMRTLW